MPLYEVKYVVAREEFYRVKAKDEKEAEAIAFEEGQLVDTGKTTNVEKSHAQLVSAN